MLVSDLAWRFLLLEMNIFGEKFPFLFEIVTIRSPHVMFLDRACRLPYNQSGQSSPPIQASESLPSDPEDAKKQYAGGWITLMQHAAVVVRNLSSQFRAPQGPHPQPRFSSERLLRRHLSAAAEHNQI